MHLAGNTLAFIGDKALTWVDGPLVVVIGSVWAYWFLVVAMSFYKQWATGLRGAIRPRQRADRWLMRGWAAVIIAWNAFPTAALRKDLPPWGPFPACFEMPLLAVRWGSGIAVLGCLLVTCCCWYVMGRSWSVAIVKEGEDQPLVTTGLFGVVRHPIYALSALMITMTAITCASFPIAIVALVHIVLLNIKARREEQALLGVFGDAYRGYMNQTGGFVPKLGNSSIG
ncbi:MAG: isoprenylcysteine carboxylmethyltransferase family protein [Phycisphaeraceae bacterium]|nr:isoprenylcysteine carboxylmethyltransferase family protein [Phycisphaeraceae bacterium]